MTLEVIEGFLAWKRFRYNFYLTSNLIKTIYKCNHLHKDEHDLKG